MPIAITAFTAETLKSNNIQSASDLQHFVPTLATLSSTRDEQAFFIRGQGPNGGVTGAPGVVTYFAEAPFSGGGPGLYYDLANVQVLEGPQGTLFGRNTTGGAVLFEPKKPVNDFEGYAQVTLGNYNRHDIEFALNIPIVDDKLLVRVAGNRAERDGFTKDVTTGQDLDNNATSWAGRLSVIFRPTDDFENYTVYDSFYSDTNGTGIVVNAVNPDPATSVTQTFGLAAANSALAAPTGSRAEGSTDGERQQSRADRQDIHLRHYGHRAMGRNRRSKGSRISPPIARYQEPHPLG